MSTTTIDRQQTSQLTLRILREGYGEGAWHGPDLKAALGDVTSGLAFWRPGPGRHNIAEIALHHAYTIHGVRAKLGGDVEPFVLAGEDWFELPDESRLSWSKVLELVALEHERLEDLTRGFGASADPAIDAERFNQILGITCHAAYHAGQIQLVKRLR
jgi:DinB family protein